jgi:tetratricopeptide (TPR) repeat protein
MAKKPKDSDLADKAIKLQAAFWSLAGAFMGAMAGFMIAQNLESGLMAVIVILSGPVVGFLATYFISTRLTFGTAQMIGKIYHPSGSSTPPVREYSRARALAMQGDFEQAAAAWELNVAEYPDDPVPYLEAARLHRNDLKNYEEAVKWYKRAMDESQISGGQLLLATQEITEIFSKKLNQPRKAIPYLADYIRHFPDDPSVDGAKKQLESLHTMIRTSQEFETVSDEFDESEGNDQ